MSKKFKGPERYALICEMVTVGLEFMDEHYRSIEGDFPLDELASRTIQELVNLSSLAALASMPSPQAFSLVDQTHRRARCLLNLAVHRLREKQATADFSKVSEAILSSDELFKSMWGQSLFPLMKSEEGRQLNGRDLTQTTSFSPSLIRGIKGLG